MFRRAWVSGPRLVGQRAVDRRRRASRLSRSSAGRDGTALNQGCAWNLLRRAMPSARADGTELRRTLCAIVLSLSIGTRFSAPPLYQPERREREHGRHHGGRREVHGGGGVFGEIPGEAGGRL